MFTGCMERMRQDGCGGCARKHPCHFLFKDLLGFDRRGERPRSDRAEGRGNPFLSFLGQIAESIEAKARPRATPFRREVERQLEAMLPAGPVRIDEVARALGVSRQTLYRRLKAEGATFEAMLESLRRGLALRMIRDEGVPVKEAAWRLGFSDPAAFSRAFKRWTGTSPRAMRAGGKPADRQSG